MFILVLQMKNLELYRYIHIPKFLKLYVFKTCILFYVNYASLILEKKTSGVPHDVSKTAQIENSTSVFSPLKCMFSVTKPGNRVLGKEVTTSLE